MLTAGATVLGIQERRARWWEGRVRGGNGLMEAEQKAARMERFLSLTQRPLSTRGAYI